MKRIFNSLYGKISIVFLLLLLVLGIVQILFSVNSSMDFVRESDQKLNRNLAANLAKEFQPFLKDSIDYSGIKHTMHHLMVMNPRVEIYLLDQAGKILAFFAEPEKKVKREGVSVQPIERFLDSEEQLPIMGDDPRHLGRKKIFSAAPVRIGNDIEGFMYVILGGEQYDSAAAMVKESYIIQTTAVNLSLTLIGAGIVGLILFGFLTKRFRKMKHAVRGFEEGDMQQRIDIDSEDEIGELGQAFNQMADTIVANMEELKRTDRLRRDLIANVSHDLRSPLASMQGYLETIQMKESSLGQEEKKKYLQIIYDNTLMLSRMVGELFELSKLDAMQIKPKIETFSIAELTQDVVMKYQPTAEKLQINLEAKLPESQPVVYADIGMIERALSNLIDNALQYTPENGSVEVKLTQENKHVRVDVSDTGCGIPKDEIPLVFERFYRVSTKARPSPLSCKPRRDLPVFESGCLHSIRELFYAAFLQ